MSIFNRWGEEIFYTEDSQIGWDGKYKNKICQDGMYVYKITYICNDQNFEKIGHVYLLK